MKYYLAVDIGASSGRHLLGHIEHGRMIIEEIYRFENHLIERNGHRCWDINHLCREVEAGMRRCKELGKIPMTMGVDTWAVDYILMSADGRAHGDFVSYRDGRTEGVRELAEARVPFGEHYGRTGIQFQPFNTVYQLLAQQREEAEHLVNADRLLMMPDFLHYYLTGRMTNEYTNATTTALVHAQTGDWDWDLIASLGLPTHLFGPITMPGTEIGRLKDDVRDRAGFDCAVVLPATHDTGSAFLAVPALDSNAAYLSSGTWSLLGVELEKPLISESGCANNFTNEGGYQHRYRYLKNIMGLWLIQSIRREINGESYIAEAGGEVSAKGKKWSFADLAQEAKTHADFPSVIDVDDPSLLAPRSMGDAIRALCAATNQPMPEELGELVQCVYQSLAACYQRQLKLLEEQTGKRFTALHIVGGGCQDEYLNQLTANAIGIPVYAGPIEATALGNLLVQMIHAGELSDLQAARVMIKNSFEIKEVTPNESI